MSHIDDLVQRYLENTASDEERAELMKLIRSGDFEEDIKARIGEALRTEMLMGERPGTEAQEKAAEIFKRILAQRKPGEKKEMWVARGEQSRKHLSVRTKYSKVVRYAASLLLLGIAGVLLWPADWQGHEDTAFINTPADGFVRIVNADPHRRIVTLPDGSTLALEPGSEVRYAERFKHNRQVYLSGDAFFQVTKDPAHPFLVYANEVTTKVLGTSFRIKANRGDKEIVVAVKTGKVSVTAKPSGKKAIASAPQQVTLTPNQQAVYKRNEQVVVKEIVAKPQVISGQPSFKDNYVNAQVTLILDALAESYGVEIRYDGEALSGCTLTSDAIEGEGLYEQLEIVCNALGGTYKMEDDASITIEAGGCR